MLLALSTETHTTSANIPNNTVTPCLDPARWNMGTQPFMYCRVSEHSNSVQSVVSFSITNLV